MKIKYIAICLVLLCCIIGTASAAEDISTDVVSDSVDDVAVDAVQEEIDDSSTVDETGLTVSDDTTIEEINEDIKTDEISEGSADVDSEPTRTNDVNAADWITLQSYSQTPGTDYTIHLTHYITVPSKDDIVFANSATIIGTPNNYITGGTSSKIIFQSTGSLEISFINVTFKNMDASVLIKLATTGTNSFINCSFDNIHTYAYKSSVIWNDKGFMNISGCNFTNCNDGFGAITNYASISTDSVLMNVENCRFENNTGRNEPGAINNCGELNVTNCTFIHNVANWWAGAIHTHTFSHSRIVDSNFTRNVAGWNGGALFSYGTLEVINCNFDDNNCSTNTGGGAICGYSYQGSIYNITVDSCNFTHNLNKNSNGRGGAIGVQNIGYLTVFNCIFKNNNNATNGTAISAICENITYCINCTNCNCTNCPNCTNCTHNVSTGDPDCVIYNNTYLNHGGPGDTVVISGNDYVFYDNIFRNSVQTKKYNESGNQYGLPVAVLSLTQPVLGASLESPILSLGPSDEIYVNASSSNDWSSVDGQSWENAVGGTIGLSFAFGYINENGIIHLADTRFPSLTNAWCKNFTVIGLSRENTIIELWKVGNEEDPDHYLTTFINMTFLNVGEILGNDVTFINCTFINFKTKAPINDGIDENVEYGVEPPEESFVTNFINCDFINSTITGDNLIDIDKYTQINFNNCNFENIAADSIVSSTKGKFHTQDSINFNDCKFTNVTTKGIVSIPSGHDIMELVHIEGCTYDVPVTNDIMNDGGRDYINTTQSRADSNLTMDIDGENLVITLTDMEGNPIADVDEINVLVNEESIPCQMENGVATLNISDLSGKVTFSATFEGNSNFKESSASLSAVLVVNNVTVEVPVEVPVYVPVNQTATSITASDLTATAKVAKTLSVTLKDANGKVLANKAVKVTVNGKTSTVTTDKNGVAKVTVNYAKAGTYYYTFTYLGDNDYKASLKPVKVTVNKQATKATFAKKTFKVKATKKISFTLKDSKGKAIAKKKITFKVNGKTYTA
ncbi:Ig-like domain-containing protein, partial [uncultured Methanobrevibacter sp.]|uniref:Ig-like domain-containing protein n=1 Tax=uncultured Methanobrevibacter sp. TaxID=253161 RepID=UPI002625F31A